MIDLFTSQEMQAIDSVKEQLHLAEQDMERAERHKFEIWGAKLKLIRDNKWYIAFEPGCTWEGYCRDRWEMTPQRAGQLITAFDIVEQLKPNQPMVSASETSGFIVPASERHVRPLTKLETPEMRAEVWRRIITNSNGCITAKVVADEVEKYIASQNKNWMTLTEFEEFCHPDAELTFMSEPEMFVSVNRNKIMNEQSGDSIEWAAWSWNPITGCMHNCAYCYARDFANRVLPQRFEPSFIPERLYMPSNTKQIKPRWEGDIGHGNVFTCSMADLFGKWVPQEWIEAILNTITDNPQWTFLLLSKFPIRMAEFEYPPNVWLGTTVDYQHAVERAEKAFTKIKVSGFGGICWLSCEPMMERLTFDSLDMFDWVVMGGASKSTQTPEHRPPFDDIVYLYTQARQAGCMVYQKTNLIPGMNDNQRVREYPRNSQ
jgi:protein gp37